MRRGGSKISFVTNTGSDNGRLEPPLSWRLYVYSFCLQRLGYVNCFQHSKLKVSVTAVKLLFL